jgi:hypothetical protein
MGSAFPDPPFDAVIHSVYPSALNLSVSGSSLLITLITDSAFLHPLSALVRGCDVTPVRFDRLGLQRGMTAVFGEKELEFQGGPRISFGDVHRYSASREQPPSYRTWQSGTVERRGRLLAEAQRKAGCEINWDALTNPGFSATSCSRPFSGRFIPAARRLFHAFRRGDREAAFEAAQPLIGLGEGLTPGGDDFLCGFALAAWTWRRADTAEWISRIVTYAGAPPVRTTDVSLSFLKLAEGSLFSQALVNLASVPDPEAGGDTVWGDMLAILGRMGHSSGLDAAAGFLYGRAAGQDEIPISIAK